MKYIDGLNYLDQLKHYVQTSLSIKNNVQQTIIHKVEQREDCDDSELTGNTVSLNVKLEDDHMYPGMICSHAKLVLVPTFQMYLIPGHHDLKK